MALLRGQKLDMQECLLDTPKMQSQLSQVESSLVPFREYVTLLRDTFQACHLHQEKAGEGTRAIANLLGTIDDELGEKAGSTSHSAFSQLARYQTELYSCQEMLGSQLQNAVVNKLSALLEEDMDNLQALRDTYDSSRQEHEHAMAKFSRTSKRRDSDKARFEANAELYSARKRFYQCTLDYISQLKEFKMRRRFMLLEPVLTFMHAQMGYFKACQEIMNSGFQQLLTNLNGDIQSYHNEHESEVTELQRQKTELELQFPVLCVPDPDLADPFTEFPTADTGLSSKYGYLYLRIQKAGLAAKWERTFFFTKNGHLYTQSLQKSAEALLQLKEADAFVADCDDRRYVIQISHPALRKPVFLQAESDVQRTEWISVIRNNSVRKSQHATGQGQQGSDGVRLRTRLYDSLERERIRSWASKELLQQQQDPSVGSSTSSSLRLPDKASSGPGGLKTTSPSRSKSPLRSGHKMSSHTNSGSGSRESKSPQRTFGQFLAGRGTSSSSRRSASSHSLPPSLSSSKLADVQNWVHSTNAATAVARPPPLSPPSASESIVKFPVKYLGQKEVMDPKNPATVSGTIRGVLTARAVKKVKPATSIELVIQHKKITLTDTQSNKAIGGFLLRDIVNCSTHPEDTKLLGVICRIAEPERVKFICHVMQADQSGSQVYGAISTAIQNLWRTIQSRESGGHRSTGETSSKPQSPPARPPPPVAPYSGSFLTSYSPAPAGLASSAHNHQRTRTAPGAVLSTLAAPSLPNQHRSSSDSNLPRMEMPRSGNGSGLGEEVGVAGSGTMMSISVLPPSLPESSSTSAESLGIGHDGDGLQIHFGNRDSPLMFADILEENEDLPLISFDQSILGTTPTPDPSPLPDGYIADGGRASADFSNSPGPAGDTAAGDVQSKGGGGGGVSGDYVGALQPSSSLQVSSPAPLPTSTSSQLQPPPPHISSSVSSPSHSPPPPSHTHPSPTHPSPTTQPPPATTSSTSKVSSTQQHTSSGSSKRKEDKQAAKYPVKAKTTDSETGQTAPSPALSAADSLAQALGFETIPSHTTTSDSTSDISTKASKENGTTTAAAATTSTASVDPLAEAFGFDTTPEDIENLIELMAPLHSDPQHPGGGVASSGYMSSNPMQTDTCSDWSNFGNL